MDYRLEQTADFEKLKKKYLDERDKRLRGDGLAQYREVDLRHGQYSEDPFSKPIIRDPVETDVNVLIIGAGHAGLLVADALVKEGVADFLIVEKGGDFGGTWYWNRYPDCRCDIESYIYMPLVDEDGVMPTEKYARSHEIRANAARIGRKLGLYEKTLFQTAVTSANWDPASSRWIIGTERNDVVRARFVCLGSGPMSRPKLPDIPGLDRFKGKTFHTSRWDYAYTGGDETGNLSGLRDKRVALVGTGATGIQAIPRLAESAKHLYVVQRTPAAVSDRRNKRSDSEWWSSLEAGWWEQRARNFASITVGGKPDIDLVDDTWTRMFAQFNNAAVEADNAAQAGISPAEMVDYRIMQTIRDTIDQQVQNKKTAESLKPYYNYFCKRPLYLDGYYETFNRENVTLVDTKGRGLDEITEHEIVFNGERWPVDCIIFASGFEVAVPLDRAGGFELAGKNGLRLKDRWRHGLVTLHGMFVSGFPSLCLIGGVRQASFSWNVSYILRRQSEHFAHIVRKCLDRGADGFEVLPAAELKWLAELDRASTVDLKFLAECTPGYINNEGVDVDGGLASQGYGDGVLAYSKQLADWRADAMKDDFQFF